ELSYVGTTQESTAQHLVHRVVPTDVGVDVKQPLAVAQRGDVHAALGIPLVPGAEQLAQHIVERLLRRWRRVRRKIAAQCLVRLGGPQAHLQHDRVVALDYVDRGDTTTLEHTLREQPARRKRVQRVGRARAPEGGLTV